MTLETIQYITFAYGGYIRFALFSVGLLLICTALKLVALVIENIIDLVRYCHIYWKKD
jgi:hypothetical protein